jgi:hypothetical protein
LEEKGDKWKGEGGTKDYKWGGVNMIKVHYVHV